MNALLLTLIVVSSQANPVDVARPEPLSQTEFRRIVRELTPSETEPWRTIPWRISLLEAQRIAAAEKKPIFIWAMDGHPLGCT